MERELEEKYEEQYKEIKDEIKSLGSNPKITKINDIYETKISHVLDDLYNLRTTDGKEVKQKIVDFLDILRNEQEDYLKDYISTSDKGSDQGRIFRYPTIDNLNLAKRIQEHPEFKKTEHEASRPTENGTLGFIRSSSQKFAKYFLLPETPYRSLMLYHEVGVGKTCAAIGVAETYRQSILRDGKKILILLPSGTLEGSWREEIFSITKERNNPLNLAVHCGGTWIRDALDKMKPKWRELPDNVLRKLVDRQINRCYSFMGYLSFANMLENEFGRLGSNPSESSKISLIQNLFSNTVLIADEVHSTRSSGAGDDKKARPYLEMITRYAENMRLVVLTATPMYNTPGEIIWLINLLRWNDGRGGINEDDYFTKDGDFKENMKEDFQKKIGGYISYVRGQDPFLFPARLNPINSYTPSAKKTFKIKDKKLVLEKIPNDSKIPEDVYGFYASKLPNQTSKQLVELEKEFTSFDLKPIQMGNIVYPKIIENDDLDWSSVELDKDGWDKNIKESGGKITLKSNIFDKCDIISPKMKTIIENIKNLEGIAFIYSRFLYSGVKPLAVLLELAGFALRNADGSSSNLLTNPPKHKFCVRHNKLDIKHTDKEKEEDDKYGFKQAHYIYIDGSIAKPSVDKMIRQLNSESNLMGENIKVILGTKVVEQGVTFKNVRAIHLLEPWYHMNLIEQVTGRGARRKSHILLPEEMRNVLIYLHCCKFPENVKLFEDVKGKDIETADERLYRLAFEKSLKIAKIQRIMKEASVDCYLTEKNVLIRAKNYSKDEAKLLNPIMKDGLGFTHGVNGDNPKFSLEDKDGSKECDYESCDYECFMNDKTSGYDENSEFNTTLKIHLEDDIQSAEAAIRQYMQMFPVTTGSSLEIEFEKRGISKDSIYLALEELINQKGTMVDSNGQQGYSLFHIPPDHYIISKSPNYPILDDRIPFVTPRELELNDISPSPIMDNVDLESDDEEEEQLDRSLNKVKTQVEQLKYTYGPTIYHWLDKIGKSDIRQELLYTSLIELVLDYSSIEIQKNVLENLRIKQFGERDQFLRYLSKIGFNGPLDGRRVFSRDELLKYMNDNGIYDYKEADIKDDAYLILLFDSSSNEIKYVQDGKIVNKIEKEKLDEVLKIPQKYLNEYRPKKIDLFYGYVSQKKGNPVFYMNYKGKEDGEYMKLLLSGNLSKKSIRKGSVCGAHPFLDKKDTELIPKILELTGIDDYFIEKGDFDTKLFQKKIRKAVGTSNILEISIKENDSEKKKKSTLAELGTLCGHIEIILRIKSKISNQRIFKNSIQWLRVDQKESS